MAVAATAVALGAQAAPALAIVATAKPPGALEGTELSSTVASFTDGAITLFGCGGAATYTAAINWGDGTTTPGTVTGGIGTFLAGCLYAINGSHTYAEEGPVSYSVAIAGGMATGSTGPATVDVRDAPLSARAAGFTANQNSPSASTVASFTDANPGATPADFTATVSWGDGTTAAGVVAAAPAGGFAVTATHTYTAAGAFNSTVSIKDAGGSQAGAGATVTVAPPPPGGTPPGAAPPPAPLRLGLSTPVLARGGTVIVGVRCPVAARQCRGRLNVATLASLHSRLAPLRRAQTIGSTLFIIPGGRRAELSVRPKRTLVALLRQAGAVKVAAYASSFDAATGRSQVASLTATLQLARAGA